MAKVVTVTIAVVFTVLSHFWACNPGKPRWRKRELITDIWRRAYADENTVLHVRTAN